MKKIINRITFVLAAVMLLVSCEADYIMFDSSKTFVAFPSKTTTVLEQGGLVAIPVYVVALKGSPAITVDFEFDVTDLPNAAVEGVDYTLVNDSKTLSFSNGWGYDTIWIEPIDNDIFEGNKAFNIVLTSNSQNYDFGATSSNAVALVDDEHPLKAWIGTYSVEALSYGKPGTWDETWSVTTSSTEGDLESLTIVINTGSGGGEAFLAGIDTEEMTITIAAGTDAGNVYGYGPTGMYVGDYATIDTEAAVVGAAFADLDIGAAAAGDKGAPNHAVKTRQQEFFAAGKGRGQITIGAGPGKQDHFGQLCKQIFAVAAYQTTGADDLFAGINQFQNRLQGFLNGRSQEGAGIDNHGVGPLDVVFQAHPGRGQLFTDIFGINQVFGTTEADDSDSPGIRHHLKTVLRAMITRPPGEISKRLVSSSLS